MALMPLLKNPSRTVHAVCAYWLTSSDGSNANAPRRKASNITASTRVSVRARRPPIAPHLIALSSFTFPHALKSRTNTRKGGLLTPKVLAKTARMLDHYFFCTAQG